MNFAFLASLAWLVTTPTKLNETDIPREELYTGGYYIIQNEADASILQALDPGLPGYRVGAVNTTKWRISDNTTWLLNKRSKDENIFTLHSVNNSYNELAILISPTADNGRLDSAQRYWNISFAGRSYGFDKWLIIDQYTGRNGDNMEGLCLENSKKGGRVRFSICDKEDHKQRWRFCLCKLPDQIENFNKRHGIVRD